MKQTNGKHTAFLLLLSLLSIRAATGAEHYGQHDRGTPVILANAGNFSVDSGNNIKVLHRYVKDERNDAERGYHEISVLLESKAQIDKLSLTLDQRDPSLYPQSVTARLFVDNTVVYDGEFDPQKPITMLFSPQQVDAFRVTIENLPGETNPVESMRFLQTPQAAGKRFMLIGNSITLGVGDGDNDRVGFRRKLYDKLIAGGFSFDFVGKAGYEPTEGHFLGGKKIYDFYPISLGGRGHMNVEVDCMNEPDYLPNIVAIHLGTNDLNSDIYAQLVPYSQGGTFTNTKSGNLATLIDFLLKWHNGEKGTHLEKILVSQIVPVTQRLDATVTFNIEVNRMVLDFQRGIVTGKPEPVYLCDHFSPFFERPDFTSLMYDDLHPNASGYTVMADTYYKAIRKIMGVDDSWFTDRTWESGTYGFDENFHFKGIAIADITGDGFEDIYVSRSAPANPNSREAFYVNEDGHLFQERAEAFHIEDSGKSHASVFVDIDNDGDFDLFNGNSGTRNRLYENIINADFNEITESANIAQLPRYTNSVLAFDCENDGDMDIFALNSIKENELYINRGNGKFDLEDRGVNDVYQEGIYSQTASAADFDNDGDTDIYVVKRNAENKLFINDGAGFFTERAGELGLNLNHKSNGASWVDLDNDGDLDLAVTVGKTSSDTDPLIRIYRNNGTGRFTDVSSSANIKMSGYSAFIEDFDNDGDLDVITTNEALPGEYYRNDGNWRFTRQSNTGAEINGGDVRGAAVFDYDNDGDLDLFATRADVFNVFKENGLQNSNHYLRIKVYGPSGGIGGFGTKIWIYRSGNLGDSEALLAHREVVSGTGYICQYSPIQHFGLADRGSCDILARFVDGTYVAIRNVLSDQTITIRPELPSGESGPPAQITNYSGDGQQNIVGQELQDPVAVRVIDALGRPVSGADVTFDVENGDAQLYVRDAVTEAVWIEAESGQLGENMQWVYDVTSSGNGFVMLPPSSDGQGTDILNAEITEAGEYTLWIRLAHTTASSALALSLDSGPQRDLLLEEAESWQWLRAKNGTGDFLRYALDAGVHTLVLSTNTENLHIDRVLFTLDGDYIPTGVGEDGNTLPRLTDREGLARRFVQLGQQAGPVEISARLFFNGELVPESPVYFNVTALPGPAVKAIISGDGQPGEPGIPLASPFVVTLNDAFDNPVSNVTVLFQVIAGDGILNPAGSVLTDSQGRASTVLTPGESSSLQLVKAEVEGIPGSPFFFTASIRGIARDLQYVSGDSQSAAVMDTLKDPIVFKVITDSDEPAVSYPVSFSVIAGGGRVFNGTGQQDSSIHALTDEQGNASIRWQLGPQQGLQRLRVEADKLAGSPRVITASAGAGTPALIRKISENGIESTILTKLPDPFVVRITDRWGNPIQGHRVSFRSVNGGGTFDGQPETISLTDSNGDAEALMTLGTLAGRDVYVVHASATVGGDTIPGAPVVFYASARPGTPALVQNLTTDSPVGKVGERLDVPFRIKITDLYNNPVPEHSVRFRIVEGNGKIDGADESSVVTNSSGKAEVFLQLGVKAGINSVQASNPGLVPEIVEFTATGKPDRPDSLVYASGSGQSGTVKSTLVVPFRVRVTDRYGNPVSAQPVQFEVQGDLGHFNGSKSLLDYSENDGHAEAYLTLSDTPGSSNHVVHATGQYDDNPLTGSPVVFYASATRGAPERLIPITNNTGLLGAAKSELQQPLEVKIVDKDDKPYPDYTVSFRITAGSGFFLPTRETEISVLTDDNGVASARWVLGNAGENQKVQAESYYQNRHLTNSPQQFSAIAIPTNGAKLEYLSGRNQSASVGDTLAEPLVIKVLDVFDFPVSGHPVVFTAVKGGGFFTDSGDSSTVVETNSEGLARTFFVLGGMVGQDVYEISVNSKTSAGEPLEGSPLLITVSGERGQPDKDRTVVTATSPIPATGTAFSVVTVIPKDRFGNPLPQRDIRLEVSGLSATVTPQNGKTDQNGEFTAQASSIRSGTAVISAVDVTTDTRFTSTAQIVFLSSSAVRLQKSNGTALTGYPHSSLSEPLTVRITDAKGVGVADYPVQFIANPDSVKSIDGQKFTDSSGYASANLILGPHTGMVKAQARAPGLTGSPVDFAITVRGADNPVLTAVSGDDQWAVVKTAHENPLVVSVHDAHGRPMGNKTVRFYSADAKIAVLDSTNVKSNAHGQAQTTVTSGESTGSTVITASTDQAQNAVFFNVHTRADTARQLSIVNGNHGQQTVNDTLPTPLEIKISDSHGNGVPDQPVTFSIKKGDGSLISSPSVNTDADGTARAIYKMGSKSGVQIVRVISPAVPSAALEFELVALPDKAHSLSRVNGNKQPGIAGHKLNKPLLVAVMDRFGNGVPGIPVTFTPQPGHGSIKPVAIVDSDTSGTAKATWVLGPPPGKQYAYASHEGLLNSPIDFEATALPNTAPLFDLPDSAVGDENSEISFVVSARDAENDTIYYRVKNAPVGARFDSSNTHEFKWIPDFDQAGTYYPVISVSDHVGATTEKSLKINIKNVNRPPRLLADQLKPQVQNLGELKKPGFVDFYIAAVDDDDDVLNYLWLANGEPKSTSNTWRLLSQLFSVGPITITALVFDQEDTLSTTWEADILSSVRIKSFSGHFSPFEGVMLTWETGSEHDNTGFYVQRAERKDGLFISVSGFVETRDDRVYSYTDKNAAAGTVYFYRLEDVQVDGARHQHDLIRIEPSLPKVFSLQQNYPNPFNPSTKIRFETPIACGITVKIFDLLGQEVKTLVQEHLKAGYHVYEWDGRNADGIPAAAGIYYLMLTNENEKFVKKMILLR